MVAYTALCMLRQDYLQIDLFTPVRTCSSAKCRQEQVGKLLMLGNWVNHGWRNTERWWEKQSLLVTNATSEITIHQSFVLIFNSSAALPARHWCGLDKSFVTCWENAALVSRCVMKWACGDRLQTWFSMLKNSSVSSFACFVFSAYFTHTYLWNLIISWLLLFEGTILIFFLNEWLQVCSLTSVLTLWANAPHLKCLRKTTCFFPIEELTGREFEGWVDCCHLCRNSMEELAGWAVLHFSLFTGSCYSHIMFCVSEPLVIGVRGAEVPTQRILSF